MKIIQYISWGIICIFVGIPCIISAFYVICSFFTWIYERLNNFYHFLKYKAKYRHKLTQKEKEKRIELLKCCGILAIIIVLFFAPIVYVLINGTPENYKPNKTLPPTTNKIEYQEPPSYHVFEYQTMDPEVASVMHSIYESDVAAQTEPSTAPYVDPEAYDDPGCPDPPEVYYECWKNVDPERTVYVSNRSDTVHRTSGCSGMQYYRAMPAWEAYAHGYSRCSKCW